MAKKSAPKKTTKTARPSEAQVISKLKRKGGKTASELGTTSLHLRELEADGKVKATGTRPTGKRGRPSIEWTVA